MEEGGGRREDGYGEMCMRIKSAHNQNAQSNAKQNTIIWQIHAEKKLNSTYFSSANVIKPSLRTADI